MSNIKQNKLIIVSGAGGSGKTTVIKDLCLNKGFSTVSRVTTRKKRPYEKEGEPYFFLTEEQFKKMIDSGELLEWNEFAGALYANQKSLVNETLKYSHCVTEMDYATALRLKEQDPENIILIYVFLKSKDLKERLISRGEDKERIKQRLKIAEQENKYKKYFDLIVENKLGEVDECVNQIHNFVNKGLR